MAGCQRESVGVGAKGLSRESPVQDGSRTETRGSDLG